MFIYIFSEDDERKMSKSGYKLVKQDVRNNLWLFESKYPDDDTEFLEENHIKHVISNTISL